MRRGLVAVLVCLVSTVCWAAKKPVAPTVSTDAMVSIAGGDFAMGVPSQAPGPYGDQWFEDQTPQRTLVLSPYFLDAREVTVAEYALFLTHAGGEAHFNLDQPIERVAQGYLPIVGMEPGPMRHVTWQGASDYCAWAGKRLPTEAEWERASRGTNERAYPWPEGGANCRRAAYFTGSVPCEEWPVVGGARPEGDTDTGLQEMAGNVAEWTADWYDYYAYESADGTTDPTGPEAGLYRVVRGGGYLDGPRWIRGYARAPTRPEMHSEDLGFRCAWSEGTVADGLRGELEAAADEDRQPSPRPWAAASPGPTRLAGNWNHWVGLVRTNDHFYTLDVTDGALLAIADDGSVEAVVEDLAGPTALAQFEDRVLVADTDGGAIVQWRPTEGATVLFTVEDSPRHVLADSDGIVWASDTAIYRTPWDGEEHQALLTGRTAIDSIARSDAMLVVADRGTEQGAGRLVGTLPLAGGTITKMSALDNLFKNLEPRHVGVLDGRVVFLAASTAWPYPAFLTSLTLAGAAPSLHHYSPPDPTCLRVVGDKVVWGSRYTLVAAGLDDMTFGELTPWARPTALWAGEDGTVHWVDRQLGHALAVP